MGKTYIADSFKTTEGIDLVTEALMKGGYVGTAESLKNLIVSSVTGVTGISITPADAPTGTGIASWVALQAGTYTNFGGVVVAANSIAVISRSDTGAFSISQTALDLSDYSLKADTINNLTSTSTTQPLSANQGRVINDKIKIDSSVVPYAYANGEVLNGAIAITNGFTVPIGQTGNSTYFRILKSISGVNVDNYVGRIIKLNFTVTIENYSQISVNLGELRLFRMQGNTVISTGVLPTTINFIDVDVNTTRTRTITATYVMTQSDIDNLYWYNFLFQIFNSNAVASIVKYTCSDILVTYSNTINRLTKSNKVEIDDLYTKNTTLTETVSTNKFKLKNEKLDKIPSNNLINPDTFQLGKYYFSTQNPIVQTNGGTNVGMTDYIPVNVAGLISSQTAIAANGYSSYAVFNSSKVWLRNGQTSNQYSYVAGDEYVIFVYSGLNTTPLLSRMVNTGTVLLPIDEYTEFKPLLELTKRVDNIEDNRLTVEGIENGSHIVYGNVANWVSNGGITERNLTENYLVYSRSGAGNTWSYSPLFVPNGSNLVQVKFKAELTRGGGFTGNITVRVANSTSAAGKYLFLGTVGASGDYEFKFDPAYYNVYEGFTNFYIWFLNDNMTAGQSVSLKMTDLEVFEYLDSVNASNIEGENVKELFESTDSVITDLKSQLINKPPVVDADGTKYEIAVSNGNIVALPIIPNKAAYIGNSLLSAFGYGMAASEAQYDYYNRINSFITSINPTFVFSKVNNFGYESAETEGQLVTAINAIVSALVGDENLVVIQLGDNVNNTARNLIFNGGGCLRLLQAVREKCPLARVVWMGMWYSSVERYNTIITSCINTGSKFVSFSDLVGASSNNRIGGVHKLASSTTMTLAGVTNVVANTATNITVTFTVAGVTYISDPLDIISYSLLSGTLTYTGLWEIISNGGVASHPGDNGFRKIANKFLYEMKISDLKETYI